MTQSFPFIFLFFRWREFCGLEAPADFANFTDIVWEGTDVDALRNVYESIDDMDLFVGGLAEKPERGALIGKHFEELDILHIF